MLNKQEQGQLRQLLGVPQWQTAEKLIGLMIEKLKDTSVVRDTIEATAAEALLREGEIRGVRRFLQEIYQQAGQ